MQRVAHRAADKFGLIETEQLTYRPIHAEAMTVERNEDLANGCLLEGSAEIGFRMRSSNTSIALRSVMSTTWLNK